MPVLAEGEVSSTWAEGEELEQLMEGVEEAAVVQSWGMMLDQLP